MCNLTKLYNKEIQLNIELQFYKLTKTGSWDNKENQVLVMSVPTELSYEIKSVYQDRKPSGIKELKIIHNEDYSDMYFGGSYGASSLLGAVGELLYYNK